MQTPPHQASFAGHLAVQHCTDFASMVSDGGRKTTVTSTFFKNKLLALINDDKSSQSQVF